MPYRKNPPVKIYFPPENYNCLMTLLEKFSAMEVGFESEWKFYKVKSSSIFEKIEKYSRIINKNGNPIVQVCFYEDEASFLIEIAILQNSIYLDNPIDYFKQLSEQRIENEK